MAGTLSLCFVLEVTARSSSGHRVALPLPRVHTTAHVHRLEALGLEEAGGDAAAGAAAADGRDRLVAWYLVEVAPQLVEGYVDGAFDVPLIPLGSLAHVEYREAVVARLQALVKLVHGHLGHRLDGPPAPLPLL